MTLVYGTVATIDRNAVCQDEDCAQFGELMENHRVTHRPKIDKGKKGDCPYCEGKLHNWHDSDFTIQMNCLWRQAYGNDAGKIDPSASSLDKVTKMIKGGDIKEWATLAKVRELTAKARGITLPIRPSSATGSGTTPAATGPAPSTTAPAASAGTSSPTGQATVSAPAAQSVGAASVQPAPKSTPSASEPISDEIAKRLRSIMSGARVGPSL